MSPRTLSPILRVLPERQPGGDPRWGRNVGRPLVIGHRGASVAATENTLDAFRAARRAGADGVELDVLLCGSGEVVVCHDEDLARLAGRPERLKDLSLAAVREVDLHGGGRIPTLSEVIEELGDRMLFNIELKAARLCSGKRLAPAVAELIRGHALGGRALVSSFHPGALGRFRAAAPEIPTGLLFAANQSLPLRRAWARAALVPFALHPDHALVDEHSVARWRRGGYGIHVWTVDAEHELTRLAALGVDGVITNDPARALRCLAP